MKMFLTVMLSTLMFVSFGASAYMGSSDYVGNPERVDTIWMPGMYDNHGTWQAGHYIHFQNPISKDMLVWMPARYDKQGNYIEAHWVPKQRLVKTQDCGGCFFFDKQI